MQSISLITCAVVASMFLLVGCETSPPSGGGYPRWGAEDSYQGVPIYYRWYYADEDSYECQIRNVSSSKINIVGLCTSFANAAFIDLKQPGAFQTSLYPGERKKVYIDGNPYTRHGTTYYIKIQDWAVE